MARKRTGQENIAAEQHRLSSPVLLLLLALLTWGIGCARAPTPKPAPTPTPQQAFDHAQQTFLHGDLAKARNEADASAGRYELSNPEWSWRFQLLEAEVLVSQGKGQDALSLLNEPAPPQLARSELAIKQKVLEAGAKIIVRHLDEAEQNILDAEHLSAASNSALDGEILRTRGILEGAHNHQENAGRYYRQSLQIAHQQSDAHLELTDLNNLGHVALVQERFDEAVDWLNRARQKAQDFDNPHLSETVLGNLGWAYYKMGDFNRALTQYQEALQSAENLGAVSNQIDWLGNLGLIYQQINQPALAEKSFKESLLLGEKSANPKAITEALTYLAFVSLQSGEGDQAQKYADQAFERAHAQKDNRPAELPALLAQGELQAARGNQDRAAKLYKEVAADKASDLSLRGRAQNDLALLYERQHRLTDADRQYRAALSTIEQARASLQHEDFRLPFQANAAHLYDDYIRFLLGQGKTDEALRLADYSRARTLAEGLGVLPQNVAARSPETTTKLNPKQIAHRANSTVLFYWLGRKQSYLWAITSNRITRYPLPPAEEIDNAVQHYRKALIGWQDVLATSNPDAAYLYKVLVEPARRLIPPSSRVVVIADGSLDNLNFETLLAPGPPVHYWIEDATIMSASSLRVLAASQSARKAGTGQLLLIGDALAAGPGYPPLPNAGLEMDNVEKHFAPEARQAFAAERAVPSAYLESNPGKFSYIHFVAHASASNIDPLDSAIALSPPAGAPDAFKLYARDIKLRPLNADLVTISSCYGAGTKAFTGEGLVGLSWAFLRAGAHNVIGALWEVDDASTANLMDRLYDELEKGHRPDEALRSAKLSLLHSQDVVRKPFYWAPFQLYTGR